MPSLEIHRDGDRKLYELLDERVVVGGGDDSDLRVDGGRAVLQVNTQGTWSVRAADGDVELNGRPLTSAALAHGDVIGIGGTLLVFVEPDMPKPIVPRKLVQRAAAAAAPEAAATEPEPEPDAGIVVAPIRSLPTRSARTTEDRDRTPRRSTARRGTPPWAVMSLAVLGGITVVAIVVRVLMAGGGRGTEQLIELANVKLQRGELEVARSYLEQAEQSGPSALEQRRIADLRERLAFTEKRGADLAAIEAARRGYDHLQRVKATYLDGKPPRRAAARELIREIDEWLAEHEALCNRYEERALVVQVRDWRATYAPIAALDEPDDADDVLFAASRLVWPKHKRDYRGAIAKLDAWLATNGSSPDAATIRAKREEWIDEAGPFFEKACSQIDRLVTSGHLEIALDRARFLHEHSLPGWAEAARSKLAQVEAAN